MHISFLIWPPEGRFHPYSVPINSIDFLPSVQKSAHKAKSESSRRFGPVQFASAGTQVYGPPRPPAPSADEEMVGPPRPPAGGDDEDIVGPPRPPTAVDDEDIVGPPVGPPRPGTPSTEDDDDDDDEGDEDEDEYRVPLSNEIILKGHTKACHPCLLVFRGWSTNGMYDMSWMPAR